MTVVSLVSGGLDSTLLAVLAEECGIEQHPLFVDYGQRSRDMEFAACQRAMREHGLREPRVAQLSGYGTLIRSGLTDPSMDVMEDAFTPGRNLMFLLVGAAYGYTIHANAVAIGLLHESSSLFPDQTPSFILTAEQLLTAALGRALKVLTPLSEFTKADVVRLARQKGIEGTYSCHSGGRVPCGVCIACREFNSKEG